MSKRRTTPAAKLDRPDSDARGNVMACIHEEILIDADPDEVWAALSDWGALHTRLVPGFVVDTTLDGEDRIVTFAGGAIVREQLLDRDERARRLAWTIVDGPYAHHSASAQVFAAGAGRSRFVWIADLLPAEAAERTGAMMAEGTRTVKRTLEAASTSASAPSRAPAAT
jgi:Polyketide cyclase / dehydrase and lipid transport